MSPSGALACCFAASRLAAPRRLAAALAAAAPSEDIRRLPSRSLKSAPRCVLLCGTARAAPLGGGELCEPSAIARNHAARCVCAGKPSFARRATARWRENAVVVLRIAPPLAPVSMGRRAGVSSEGAAAASAATRRRGAASREAAKRQARAPEEDIPVRLIGADLSVCDKVEARQRSPLPQSMQQRPSEGVG
jgi:hypothetical protein